MTTLAGIVLPVFLVIAMGWLAVVSRRFPAGAAEAVMKFAQGFAIPALLFRTVAQIDPGKVLDWRLLVSYYTGSLTVFLVGMAGAMLLFRRPADNAVAVGFAAMFPNSVLLGLPIMERAYGEDALAPIFAIIAFHAPFCYLVGSVAMAFARRSRGGGIWRSLRTLASTLAHNPLLVALFLGFLFNLSGLALPKVIDDALLLLVRGALPAALFALGGILVAYRPEGDLRLIAWVVVLSLFLHPTIAWAMGRWAFALPFPMSEAAVVTAAMAPGVNAYLFASMNGTGQRVAASAVLVGTLLSILTASFWLHLLAGG